MRRVSRIARLSLLLSTLLVAAAVVPQAVFIQEARAASEKKNVAVGAFEGAKSDVVRSAFIEALKKDGGYEVTDAEDVKHTAKDKAIVEAAKGLAVNVIITGKVTKFNLKLKVRDGSNGKTLDEVDIKGGTLPKLKTNIEKTGASSVEDPVGKAKGAEKEKEKEKAKSKEKGKEKAKAKEEETAKEEAKEEEKPAEEEAEEEEKPAEDSGAGASGGAGVLSPLDVTAGLRPIHRTFSFHQTVADVRPNEGFYQLLRYELPLGPALFIDLNIYPGSFVATGPAEWIGLTGGFEKGFATQSVFNEGKPVCMPPTLTMNCEQTLKTDMQHWYIGARFRFPIGEHQLSATGTYGQHTFALSGDELNSLIPDVKYGYIRGGIEGTFRFGDFLAGARVGKRFVLSTGPLETVWFPNTKASSLEAGVMAGYRLVSMLDLVAGFDWLRYAFDFNPVTPRTGDQASFAAGGAIDEYYSGYIAFRFHLPAMGASDGAASVSTE